MSETTTKYEIMAIIDNKFDVKAAEQYAQDSIIKKIENLKGKITFEDFWGERGFAYRINKQTWGYYIVIQFDLDKEHLEELKKEWTLDQKIVRYIISKVNLKAPEPRKYEEMKKEWVALEKENKIKEMEKTSKRKPFKKEFVPKKPITVETKPIINEVKEEVKPTESKEEKKDILDKKLDKILEDSSLDL